MLAIMHDFEQQDTMYAIVVLCIGYDVCMIHDFEGELYVYDFEGETAAADDD